MISSLIGREEKLATVLKYLSNNLRLDRLCISRLYGLVEVPIGDVREACVLGQISYRGSKEIQEDLLDILLVALPSVIVDTYEEG